MSNKDESAAAPRRSSRISALPSAAVKEIKAKVEKVTKKRPAADGEGAKEKAPKKAKSESAADSTEKMGAIEIGDSLPALTLKNEKGEDVDVSTLAAEKGVILFLVPKANTPGCTTQACGFRDSYADFTGLDYDVYCLSADSPTAQSNWQSKQTLPYPLLSDPKRALIGALGATKGSSTQRSHYIFEKGGKLVEKRNPVKPVDSSKLALEFVKDHKSS